MLLKETLFGIHDKVETAIQRLRAFEPPEGYFVAFSGGKDSQCIYHLCVEAGVRFGAHYSHTTVNPPEVIHFMREHYTGRFSQCPRIWLPFGGTVRYFRSVFPDKLSGISYLPPTMLGGS